MKWNRTQGGRSRLALKRGAPTGKSPGRRPPHAGETAILTFWPALHAKLPGKTARRIREIPPGNAHQAEIVLRYALRIESARTSHYPLAVKIRRAVQHGLLALLLLLSQQMGIAHAVSHLSDLSHRTTQNKQLPVEQVCEQCLAYAQIGAALTGPAAALPAQAASSIAVDSGRTPHFSPATVYAFHSRAPPR